MIHSIRIYNAKEVAAFSTATSFPLYIYNFRLNKIAARWPAKAVAQFYFY